MKRLVTIAMWLAVIVGLSAQPSLDVQLQRAVMNELKTGDHKTAIQEYKRIAAAAASTNHAVAAQALLREGEAEKKIHNVEWRTTYERIARDIPDQKEAINRAHAVLDAPSASDTIARRIYTGPVKLLFDKVSPDGRFLVGFGVNRSGLFLHEISSNVNRELIADAFVNHPCFTPDSRRIVYEGMEGHTPAIRIVNVDGTGDHTILRGDEYLELEVAAVSRDGKRAAVGFNRKDNTWQVGMVSLDTGKASILRNNDWRDTYVGNFSPDGHWLVYAAQVSKDGADGEIFTVATDGSSINSLVAHAQNGQPLFTPDGSTIVFSGVPSPEPRHSNLSAIRVADGRPLGAPEVENIAVGRPMGFTRDGSFFYDHALFSRSGIYVAEVDPADSRIRSAPIDITYGLTGDFQGQPRWSPNGKLLAFAVRDKNNDDRIVLHSFDTVPERELHVGNRNVARIEGWSQDGKSLFIIATGKGLRRLDTETLKQQLMLGPNDKGPSNVIATDGRIVFYATFDSGQRTPDQSAVLDTIHVRRHDLQTGADTEIYHAEAGHGPGVPPALALSPDGRIVAFAYNRADFKSRSLVVVPTSGGPTREIATFPVQSRLEEGLLAWTQDSRAVLFIKSDEIWAQPIESGAAYGTGIRSDNIGAPSVDPAGNRIAFVGASAAGREVWAVRNLFNLASSTK
jgi:Tol biopolymer transport system component